MKLYNSSLAFNINIKDKKSSDTASWGTELGQNKEYKFSQSIDDGFMTALVYNCVDDMENIDVKLGRGGDGSKNKNYAIVLASLFKKVFVNGEKIDDAEFLLLVVKQIINEGEFHIGRRTLKYGPNMTYRNVNINADSFKKIEKHLGLNEHSAWFVSEITTKNQDELHLKAYIVNEEGPMYFEDLAEKKRYINGLIGQKVKKKVLDYNYYFSIKKNEDFAKEIMNTLCQYVTEETLSILTSAEKSGHIIKRNIPILMEVNNEGELDELARDSNGELRYYKNPIYELLGRKFICTKEWFFGNGKDNRTSFLDFLEETIENYTAYNAENIIYYGAPGTGKSYKIDEKLKTIKADNKFRVTFHPEYTYNDFVGQLMPVNKNSRYEYDFVEGPFTLALKAAYDRPYDKIYLIIEELSRGNCAAIFGDLFQLLDRADNDDSEKDYKKGWSMYKIDNSAIAQKSNSPDGDKIRLPANLAIYATVNTSDQNVFVMDNAFKRRFDWEYVSTEPCNNENNIQITLYDENGEVKTDWICMYQILNKFITSKKMMGLGEDKQIGQFFIKFDNDDWKQKIQNKLLQYLWFDISENNYNDNIAIFEPEITSFSDLYKRFDRNEKIFSDMFIKEINDFKTI